MKDSLYEQITVTLLVSELTYTVSLIRELARRGQLEGDWNEAALKLPMNAAELKRVIDANPKLERVFEGQNEDAELQFSAVESLRSRNQLRNSVVFTHEVMGEGLDAVEERVEKETNEEKAARRGSVATQGSQLVFFSDQADKGYREQTEMVYGIGVNEYIGHLHDKTYRNESIEKRVTVIFRGSRTPADWAQNKKFHGIAVANPVKGLKEFANDKTLSNKVYVHAGFHEYLNRKNGTPEGIFETLVPILDTRPGYSLWVTGHSLGGGLASLFAVAAASRDDIPKPVNCITHAQPLVGDSRLFRSVKKLEESKNLFLLRTRNCEDGVPAVPAFSPKPSFTYVHLGMQLKLYDDDRSENVKLSVSKPRVKSFLSNFKAMMTLFVIKTGKEKQRRAHNLREHFRRLEQHEDEIRGLGKDLEDICSRSGSPEKK